MSRIKTLFLVIALAFFVTVINTAAIPSPKGLSIPDLPFHTINPADYVKRAHLSKRDNWCGDSTFINDTGDNSPQLKECRQLADRVRGRPFTYRIPPFGMNGQLKELEREGFCIFGAKGAEGEWTKLGNEDIADLITSSIAMFARSGRIAAHGHMYCSALGRRENNPQWKGVYWGIYGPSG